jgi:hypothetical protein
MKKMILISIAFVLLMAVSLTFLTNSCEREFNKEKSKIVVNIGKRVVIEKDTLLITDYSFFESNYTLSNGRQVSFELINKLPIVK